MNGSRLVYKLCHWEQLNICTVLNVIDNVSYPDIQEPSMFHKRCYVSIAMMDGRVYALGGMDGEHR